MGVSFAIPIEVAMNVADQLRTTGKVSRGWLGVLIQDVTKDLAESFGMKQPSGALISRVIPDSPAEKAKLKPGDIIMEFNGRKLVNSSELPPLVGSSKVDKAAKLSVLRQGTMVELDVTIGELPAEDEIEERTGNLEQTSNKTLGIMVKELTQEQVEKGHMSNGGVLVYEVGSGVGRSSGIRRGDIIKMIDGQKIGSVKDFKEVVKNLKPGNNVAVLVQRRSGPVFLALKMPNK
jgi:serine protease Do